MQGAILERYFSGQQWRVTDNPPILWNMLPETLGYRFDLWLQCASSLVFHSHFLLSSNLGKMVSSVHPQASTYVISCEGQ